MHTAVSPSLPPTPLADVWMKPNAVSWNCPWNAHGTKIEVIPKSGSTWSWMTVVNENISSLPRTYRKTNGVYTADASENSSYLPQSLHCCCCCCITVHTCAVSLAWRAVTLTGIDNNTCPLILHGVTYVKTQWHYVVTHIMNVFTSIKSWTVPCLERSFGTDCQQVSTRTGSMSPFLVPFHICFLEYLLFSLDWLSHLHTFQLRFFFSLFFSPPAVLTALFCQSGLGNYRFGHTSSLLQRPNQHAVCALSGHKAAQLSPGSLSKLLPRRCRQFRSTGGLQNMEEWAS